MQQWKNRETAKKHATVGKSSKAAKNSQSGTQQSRVGSNSQAGKYSYDVLGTADTESSAQDRAEQSVLGRKTPGLIAIFEQGTKVTGTKR
jgi:hypothetical protein